MQYLERKVSDQIINIINNNKSVILLGPRQTGKTTLVHKIKHDRYLNLIHPELRQRYEAAPGSLIAEIISLNKSLNYKPTIIIDEIQKVPKLADSIQLLIDEQIANFILTGSSARKLTNLLPGRVIKFSLRPLALSELGNLNLTLEQILTNGLLPGIVMNSINSELDLNSYVSLYLEEEIRKEALVRNLGAFHNFLKLSCIGSGEQISFRSIAQEIGVTHNTVAEYYRILQDCMLVEVIMPITISTTRRKLTKHPKYLIFDLGVRRIGAMETAPIAIHQMGRIFEQFVGLELVKILNYTPTASLHYWRCHTGIEVDYIISVNHKYIPIEVKWTNKPSIQDAKHLIKFQAEYINATHGYIICNIPYAMAINEQITALPWNHLINFSLDKI